MAERRQPNGCGQTEAEAPDALEAPVAAAGDVVELGRAIEAAGSATTAPARGHEAGYHYPAGVWVAPRSRLGRLSKPRHRCPIALSDVLDTDADLLGALFRASGSGQGRPLGRGTALPNKFGTSFLFGTPAEPQGLCSPFRRNR